MLCQKPLRAESKILFHARFQFSTDSRRVTLHTKLLARTQKTVLIILLSSCSMAKDYQHGSKTLIVTQAAATSSFAFSIFSMRSATKRNVWDSFKPSAAEIEPKSSELASFWPRSTSER